MSNFTGFIEKIGIKTGTSKRGQWKLYSFKMSDVEHWLSAGFDAPAAKEGDYVSIEAEQNDKGYWDVTSLKQVKNAPAKTGSATAANSPAKGTQTSIHYQSARKDAISVIELLLTHKALPMSAAATAAGTAKRYEEITALVDKLTVRYFNDAETHRILEDVTDEGSTKEEAEEVPSPGTDEVDDA